MIDAQPSAHASVGARSLARHSPLVMSVDASIANRSTRDAIAFELDRALRSLEPALARARERFDGRLASGTTLARSYEDEIARTCALSVIPTERLRADAETIAREANEMSTSEEDRLSERDALLLALLAWFKNDFFSWVDKPPCEHCGSNEVTSKGVNVTELTAEEREGEAGRVELYECAACRRTTRFARYNSALKLLETRRGRCGEWANAFTLCCRAMGFRARWVLDWTDHVWTEVYSESQNRWLHCDPCENVCDKPLLYEVGWGKKLSYVIAFSIEGVFDVTRRYTKNMKERYRLRGEVYEPWLKKRLEELTREIRMAFLPDEIKELEAQDAIERDELERPATDVGESLPGRTTGSYSWRRARGELGNQS